MTDKRYQVFLSSTFTDLEDERLAVTQAILSLRGIPAGMEMFQASTLPPWEVITPIIDTTDYFVLMLAGRYGSVNDAGLSYTEREYDFAYDNDIPVLAFLHGAPQEIPGKYSDTGRQAKALEKFRRKVSSRHTVMHWRNSAGLAQAVTSSLIEAFQNTPRPGYVRGGVRRPQDGHEQVDTSSGASDSLVASESRLPPAAAVITRQNKFRYRSEYAWQPMGSGVPVGWSGVPLLILRATAALAPADADTVEPIRTETRTRLTTALNTAALNDRLRDLFERHLPASASAYLSGAPQPSPGEWHVPPGSHHTTLDAAYRLGGDASSGVGALATVALPRLGRADIVRVTVDVGVSVTGTLSLIDLATVLRDALSAAALLMPNALAGLLPPGAGVRRVELHLLAENADAQHQSRPNDLDDRVDWTPLGPRTRNFGRSLGTAVEVTGSLTERDTAELVAGAIEQMVTDGGALDPQRAVDEIRQTLAISSQAR